jgi:hypothetical protein
MAGDRVHRAFFMQGSPEPGTRAPCATVTIAAAAIVRRLPALPLQAARLAGAGDQAQDRRSIAEAVKAMCKLDGVAATQENAPCRMVP